MSTEWMGRFRNVIGALVQQTNLIWRKGNTSVCLQDGIQLSIQEWQVFEYIIEHKYDDDRMMLISDRLGIPQSSFSKIGTKLAMNNLVEKYQMVQNKKNIILKPTPYGEQIYLQQVNQDTSPFFEPFFKILEDVDDATLQKFADAINALNDEIVHRNSTQV